MQLGILAVISRVRKTQIVTTEQPKGYKQSFSVNPSLSKIFSRRN